MKLVRTLCQLAHAQRQLVNIKIRQPLSCLDLHCPTKLSPQLLKIIADEVNVKQVNITKQTEDLKVILESTITPELAAEGEYRDLVRNIQVLRKNRSLRVQDRIKIFAPEWPKIFEKQILEKTLADSIQKGDTLDLEKIS
jgi:isoleucyl-tRNA synthetase